MRLRYALALIPLLAAALVASCSEGGNGVGTAPPATEPCPSSPPKAGDPCKALQVCNYGGDAGTTDDIVAICPFAGGTWELHTAGEAGTFVDAQIPETATDGASDGETAVDGDSESDAVTSDASTDVEVDSETDSGTDDSADAALGD